MQEFQFGMNWSEYSRFVGDIFGAPLAFEGLIAFFFESTFIGLWIFGWSRLPRLVHLACIWIVAIAVNASAYFIIAANSFMQHPVGARFNPETGRAELIDFGALLTNNTAIWAFLHAVTGAFLTAGTFVAGVSAWLMVRSRKRPEESGDASSMYRPATIAGSLVALAAAAGLFFTGDIQGKLMFVQQPMKMASAESLCHTRNRPGLLDPDDRHAQQLRQRHAPHRGALRAAVPGREQVRRRHTCRASRTFSSPTRRSSGRATTGPTCSSPTGRSAR